ncbi:hypothetical protein BKM03_00185 [Pseudomonas avellanae]|uniref:Uncharacterized protein n=1 Tax=Pseudomonas avellanae TaxID=46257 RepID=A0AAD0GLA9_9PSED|nr:hypothetical protein BKM03_00185 [Pseudomonas avellanae]POP81050.1 hypothetical protein CXB34_24760 [Pseudomonas amygdali pv. morsprunorum]
MCELVRESFISGGTSLADVPAHSRTSEASPGTLPRPSARIKSGLVYNAGHWHDSLSVNPPPTTCATQPAPAPNQAARRAIA